MSPGTIHTDIRTNTEHRWQFYDLTRTVFGFDLRQWHELGYWTPKYTPHAYINDGRMVANVSTYEMQLLLDGRERRAVQVGTVMTHPNYRGRGYASELMDHVVREKENEANLFFLFTSPHLIPFYQQSGFEVVRESRMTCSPLAAVESPDVLRRIDPKDDQQRAWLWDRVQGRRPVSNRFGILDGPEIFMYHAVYRYDDAIWYNETQDCVILWMQTGTTLHLLDIVANHDVDALRILASFRQQGVDMVELHFTPDQFELDARAELVESDDVFMVRGDAFAGMHDFRHPVTLEA